jgi:acyl carrier protein
VAELGRSILPHDTEMILEAIVAAVSGEFEIRPVRITLLRAGTIIKTSSGKIMRRANRESLLDGSFEVIADRTYEAPEITPTAYEGGELPGLEQFIVAWASARLNKGMPVNPDNSLTAYGIDSMRAVELSEEIKSIYGLEWAPYQFFDEVSISQLTRDGLKLTEGSQERPAY